MAGVQLTEEEQSERLKQWWAENGVSVVVGVVLGIAVIVGVNYWRTYQAEQAAAASALYMQIVEGGGDAAALGTKLREEYPDTPYAGKAALVMAKNAFQDGGVDDAVAHLNWVVDNGSDPADRTIARLRLARILLDAGEPDRVDALLAGIEPGGYESEYRELLGDLAMARDDPQKARAEYRSALDSLPEQSGFADMLNLKLDAAIGASQ